MKKLLLSLAVLLGFVAAQAGTVTIEPADWDGKWTGGANGYTATINGITITTNKAQSSSNLVEPDGNSIRVYAKSEITISAESAITSIVFTTGASSKKSDLTYSEGWTGDTSVDANAGKEITITSDGLTSMTMHAAAQVRIAKIEVTIDGEVTPDPVDPDPVDPDPVDPDPVDPDPVVPGEDGEVVVLPAQLTNVPGVSNVGGYKFDFEKNNGMNDPKVYDEDLRIYAKGTMTVSGKKLTKIIITLHSANVKRYAPFTPSVGSYTTTQAAGDTELVWTGDVESVTFTVGDQADYGTDGSSKAGQIHIEKITVYGEPGESEGDDPNPPAPQVDKYVKATTFTTGSYLFVVDGKVATPVAENSTFGRMNLVDATVDGEFLYAEKDNAFTLEISDELVTIKDVYGRYYGMDDTHPTSFQMYTELNEGCYYSYDFADGQILLTNELNLDCWIAQTGTYNNVAPAKNPTDYKLPTLYVLDDTVGITEIVSNEDAPVVYYNLQGVQVENPSAGLYIRRQGNVTTKVLVK